MSNPAIERKPCTRCGHVRWVNGSKRRPTPLCRDCLLQVMEKCPLCPFQGHVYAMANHRRMHAKETP